MSREFELPLRLARPRPRLCACGCGRQTLIIRKTDRGLVRGQYRRFLRGHNRSRRPNPAYIVDEQTHCWNWQGYIQRKDGRAGQMVDGARRTSAYVIFFERVKGPVPAGLILDHTCRNPRCVNPDHLEAVTYAVNNQRGAQAKLNTAKVAAIRQALRDGVKRKSLAKAYHVSYAVIEEIEKGEAWR